MFHQVSAAMLERMAYLEAVDFRDRQDGTPRLERLRQITPDTGRFLALLCAGAPAGDILEIGTSGGYSTMWLALACAATGRRVTTFELLPEKATLARETFDVTGVAPLVNLVEGDARVALPAHDRIAFCFLDAEKEVYQDCYDLVIPRLVKGGWLIADNAVNQRDRLQPVLDHALADSRVDAVIIPIGNGELVCRRP
jgi:predicted O-methyltransferase YrrM